jgi:ABC-type amino acid transport substrate-binding protein
VDRSFREIMLLGMIVFALAGCAGYSTPNPAPGSDSLLVGVTPNYPPMIFKLNGEIRGLEADFAFLLSRELGRPLEFVEVDWDQQIPSLLARKIDIIMSGMSITEARKARIQFAAPYIRSGLAVLMRSADSSSFGSFEAIRNTSLTVGVVRTTTGEAYVRKNFPNAANIISIPRAGDAVHLLKGMRIDLFVHDAPAVAWLVSESEGTLKGSWDLLNEEYMGWGLRREDEELLNRVNSILARWKKDGTLKRVLLQWLPYWKDFE